MRKLFCLWRLRLWILAVGLIFSSTAFAQDQSFQTWKVNFENLARSQGITDKTLSRVNKYLVPNDRVIAFDQKQPEKTKSFAEYMASTITPERVREARQKYNDNRDLLDQIENKYHVQAEVLVAIWAMESNFGENQGGFNTLTALANLAYDGRRQELFEEELVDALLLIQNNGYRPDQMTGSWAGAMGQCQFMPSSLLKYGVDQDGNGVVDIWGSVPDALASIANYLSENQWDYSQGIALQVKLPDDFDDSASKEKLAKPLTEWHALGVTRPTGAALYLSGAPATLVEPDGSGGQAFLAYDNFAVLMQWNRSTYFALAVADLAGRINPKLKNKNP